MQPSRGVFQEESRVILKMENDLGRDDIGRLVWRIAIPSMLAQFVSVLYSIVDRIYIGNIPKVGDIALASVRGVRSCLLNAGGQRSLSGRHRRLSPHEHQHGGKRTCVTRKEFCQLLSHALCTVRCAVAVIFPLARPDADDVRRKSSDLSYAIAYFTTCYFWEQRLRFSPGMNQFIICQGFAKIGMISVMLGAVRTLRWTRCLSLVLVMGVQGRRPGHHAVAAGQLHFCAGLSFSKRVPVRIRFGGYRFSIMRQVLKVGFTPFIIIAIDNVMIIAMNAVLQHYGGAEQGDMLVTTATIVQSFMLVVTMPLGGISGGTQTILGFNYGACNTQRVRQAVRRIAWMCVGYTGVLFVLARLAGPCSYVCSPRIRPWQSCLTVPSKSHAGHSSSGFAVRTC